MVALESFLELVVVLQKHIQSLKWYCKDRLHTKNIMEILDVKSLDNILEPEVISKSMFPQHICAETF